MGLKQKAVALYSGEGKIKDNKEELDKFLEEGFLVKHTVPMIDKCIFILEKDE